MSDIAKKMSRTVRNLILISFVVFGSSCYWGNHFQESDFYLGGWGETQLSFSPAIKHTTTKDAYYEHVFAYKFAGMVSEEGLWARDYDWLRYPRNLTIAFNTAKAVGLEKLISKEQYFTNETGFYSGDWEGQSLNDVIKAFLISDTSAETQDSSYFTEFWSRRRDEGNSRLVYTILSDIDSYYNYNRIKHSGEVNDTLKSLLTFDYNLKTVDSSQYTNILMQYFGYLTSIGLQHSAYDLVEFNHPARKYPLNIPSDSLIGTLDLDTITYENWITTNQNTNGWIDYRRYDGP